MRRISCFIVSLLFSLSVRAQRILPQVWFNENNISDHSIQVGDRSMLYGLTNSRSETQGDYFWNQDFQLAQIYFYPQKIRSLKGGEIVLDSLYGVNIRFDLWNDNVEFQSDNVIKVISCSKVSNVILRESGGGLTQFINPKEFGSKPIKGLYELLKANGNKAFLKSIEILVQRADYNPALDTGSKDPQIKKLEHYYFWDGSLLHDLDNKKQIATLITSLGLDARRYFKGSKNNFKTTTDYKKLAHFVFESLP